MSDVKKPMAGEWWEIESGFRVRIIGRKLDGIFLCEEMGGKVNRFDIKNAHWKHLPDCDSFDWKPEVFPQYWTTLDRDSNLPTATAFVIRKNKVDWNLVWKNGDHGIAMGAVSKWSPSGRTQITKEQAEALLLPEDWVVQDRVPARAGVDQRAYHNSGDGAGISPYSWADASNMAWDQMPMHGHKHGDTIVHLRCRRKDLPTNIGSRNVTIIRWLCWNDTGKHRLIHASEKPNGFKHCMNVGKEKFEVSL